MSINQAMYTGVSGLNVNGENMSIVANNIANANTKAFKTDRGEFEDLFNISLNDSSSFGRGARMRGVTTDFTQGVLTVTGGITDLAIQGDGFFMVKNNNTDVQESGGNFFTRQGSFRFDKDGFLTDLQGGKVQGFDVDEYGKVQPNIGDIQIGTGSIPPQATSLVNLNVNLDPRERAPSRPFDINDASRTSNFATTVTIYDTMGRGHLTTMYFAKEGTQETNKWKWYATVDSSELKDGETRNAAGEALPTIIAQGDIEFDSDGKPVNKFQTKDGKEAFIDILEKSDKIPMQFGNGARVQDVQFNFGRSVHEGGELGSLSSTSIASKTSTIYHSQNGYQAGNLKSIKIELDGSLRGVYTNGLERKLKTLALATFANNNGLDKAGNNSYISTPKSGTPRIGEPQTASRGSIYSANLEESNVDLAKQFVDMIITQRGFQANSKSITTSDTLLDEIINLKR